MLRLGVLALCFVVRCCATGSRLHNARALLAASDGAVVAPTGAVVVSIQLHGLPQTTIRTALKAEEEAYVSALVALGASLTRPILLLPTDVTIFDVKLASSGDVIFDTIVLTNTSSTAAVLARSLVATEGGASPALYAAVQTAFNHGLRRRLLQTVTASGTTVPLVAGAVVLNNPTLLNAFFASSAYAIILTTTVNGVVIESVTPSGTSIIAFDSTTLDTDTIFSLAALIQVGPFTVSLTALAQSGGQAALSSSATHLSIYLNTAQNSGSVPVEILDTTVVCIGAICNYNFSPSGR